MVVNKMNRMTIQKANKKKKKIEISLIKFTIHVYFEGLNSILT